MIKKRDDLTLTDLQQSRFGDDFFFSLAGAVASELHGVATNRQIFTSTTTTTPHRGPQWRWCPCRGRAGQEGDATRNLKVCYKTRKKRAGPRGGADGNAAPHLTPVA